MSDEATRRDAGQSQLGRDSRLVPLLPDSAERVAKIAAEAGREILRVYRSGVFDQRTKIDESPVTIADLRSNEVLVQSLPSILDVPIVSEENEDLEMFRALSREGQLHAALGPRYWLVDPLDGTREFIERKDNFVVSVALIENGEPVLGCLYAPVLDLAFHAMRGGGAWCNGLRITNESQRSELIAVASGSQHTPKIDLLAQTLGIKTVLRYGSALKFARVAEGSADVYARFGTTAEWDIAGGRALLLESGCKLIDVRTQASMRYGKPDFINGPFVASRVDLDLASQMNQPPFQIK